MKQSKPATIFDLWPYNLLIDIFYKPEIAQRAYLPAIEPTLDDLEDTNAKDILLKRYQYNMGLQRIGTSLDISAERVRQIQMGALSRLRHPTFTVKLLTISPKEVAALNRRIRELSRACGENIPEPVMTELTQDSPIEALNLSSRSYNGLRRLRIRMLGDLESITTQDLLTARGLGSKSVEEIQASIHPHGIYLKDDRRT